jgi:hypothetical protein
MNQPQEAEGHAAFPDIAGRALAELRDILERLRAGAGALPAGDPARARLLATADALGQKAEEAEREYLSEPTAAPQDSPGTSRSIVFTTPAQPAAQLRVEVAVVPRRTGAARLEITPQQDDAIRSIELHNQGSVPLTEGEFAALQGSDAAAVVSLARDPLSHLHPLFAWGQDRAAGRDLHQPPRGEGDEPRRPREKGE